MKDISVRSVVETTCSILTLIESERSNTNQVSSFVDECDVKSCTYTGQLLLQDWEDTHAGTGQHVAMDFIAQYKIATQLAAVHGLHI